MTATLYPVATTAEGALHTPQGFAARQSEARALAAHDVTFSAEPVGPAFATREAAQAAYASGGRSATGLTAGWARLTPVAPAGELVPPRAPARPTYAEGRRWPRAPVVTATQWRLWVSYWRVGEAARREAVPDQAARRLRRSADGPELAGGVLNALARQPLRPVRPQQPLDIGLFESRLPESPDVIIPDE